MPWIRTGIIVFKYSMDANQELNEAVDRRIARETAFKEEIIAQIDAIISALEFCDPTNAASTLDLSQEQLRQVIEKLNTMDVISPAESARISDSLRTKNLRRGLEQVPAAPAAVPAAVPAAPAVPTAPKSYAAAVATPRRPATPAPQPSFLDRVSAASMGTTPQQMAQRRGGRTRRRRKTRR